MTERLRTEVLNETFFPMQVRREGGIFPAPPEVVAEYERLKREWLMSHPHLPHEEPMVSLSPVFNDREGYVVRQEIIYR